VVSRIFRAAVPAAVVLLISACSTFPTQGYNKAATGNPHSIALAPMGLPEKANVRIMAPVGANFGLIGALVEAGRESTAVEEARVLLEKANLDYQTYLPGQIVKSLQSAGFEAQQLPGARDPKSRFKFMTGVSQEPGADAVLDIYAPFLGFIAAGATTDYRPSVLLDAKLVRASDQKVLFADQIYYNNFQRDGAPKAVSIDPDPNCVFKDRESLQADPQRTAACLQGAMDSAAKELAKQFL
jgi:hypothetical protein